MEALVARSIKFTREEIGEWCDSRDWEKAGFTEEAEKKVAFLKEKLPNLSSNEEGFPEKSRTRAAEIVASIADKDSDPVADFLWVKLTQEPKKDDFYEFLGL